MSCTDHDAYAVNSQFVTNLIGRVLANQGLESTQDTAGFQSVFRLRTNTVSGSFDYLFYGLHK